MAVSRVWQQTQRIALICNQPFAIFRTQNTKLLCLVIKRATEGVKERRAGFLPSFPEALFHEAEGELAHSLVEQARGTDGGPESMRGLRHLVGTAGLVGVFHRVCKETVTSLNAARLSGEQPLLRPQPTSGCKKAGREEPLDCLSSPNLLREETE